MKDYIYISDSKVDMLWPQIGSDRTESDFENKLDFKVYSRTKKSKQTPSRVSKLEEVCRYIEKFGNLGSIQAPGEYVRGVLPMKMFWEKDDNIALWGGLQDKTLILLGGSISNLIGTFAGSSLGSVSGSYEWVMVRQLSRMVLPAAEEEVANQQNIAQIVAEIIDMLRTPEVSLEFLAKVLISEEAYVKRKERKSPSRAQVLLGTPLYVARYYEPDLI